MANWPTGWHLTWNGGRPKISRMGAGAAAPAAPPADATEIAARTLRVLDSLPENEREPLQKALIGALDKRDKDSKQFMELLESWEWTLRARQDPEHRDRIARAREPLGEVFTVDEIKQRFAPKRSGR